MLPGIGKMKHSLLELECVNMADCGRTSVTSRKVTPGLCLLLHTFGYLQCEYYIFRGDKGQKGVPPPFMILIHVP